MFYRFYKESNQIALGLLVFFFSALAQASGPEQVVVKTSTQSIVLNERGSKDQQSQLAQTFGLYFEWDQKNKLLKISSKNHRTGQVIQGSQVPIRIETLLPVELEGESNHPIVIVSNGGQIVGRWASPSLTFTPGQGPSSEAQYRILPTGTLEVKTLTQSSGKIINEGKILSSTSLDIEVLSGGEFRNAGLIESQALLRFKEKGSFRAKQGDPRSRFFNSGKVIAPELEVGNPLERFYYFQNGEENHGLIQTRKFFADVGYFNNTAGIQVPGRISLVGFRLDNQAGKIYSEGDLSADFAQVNNREGSLIGQTGTKLKIRENLENEKGEIGTDSSTVLWFHEAGFTEQLGKVRGKEVTLIADRNTPVVLSSGELHGQRNILIHSKARIQLPGVQLHTPVLNLAVPDFTLAEQQECGDTVVHCDPTRDFCLTSPYCTNGKLTFVQSSLQQPEWKGPLDSSNEARLQKTFAELKDEVGQMTAYFQKDAGRISKFKVFLRADLKSPEDIQFITPQASIYLGDSENGSEIGIEAKSLQAWSNFLFVSEGHVAVENAAVHAPGGLRLGSLTEHPTDRVKAGGNSFPLLCRNNGLWTTQNQTYVDGPLNCDGTMQIGGDLIIKSEKDQWSFSPDIHVEGDLKFEGSGDFNLLSHLGEIRYMGGDTTSSSMYSIPGKLRVEQSILGEKPVALKLYAASAYSDKVDGNVSLKMVDTTGNQEIQFPGQQPQRKFPPSISTREGGVIRLEGKDNEGLISAPKVFLVEENGQFILAAKNPYHFDEMSPVQDLTKQGLDANTIIASGSLPEATQFTEGSQFHFSLRERFFFNHLESEQFYKQIQDNIVIVRPGTGLSPLPSGSVVFSLSPQLMLKQVQDFCQASLKRGYLYKNRPINLELIAELHQNAVEVLKTIGIQLKAKQDHLGGDRKLRAVLHNPNNKNPFIFYQEEVNKQGIRELKPYFYLPPGFVDVAREEQTGNVFATVLGRFSEGTTAEEMLSRISERNGVRKALADFFEENPHTKQAVTQAAMRARLKMGDGDTVNQDKVKLSFPIRASHFALVTEGDIEIDRNFTGESAAFVSKQGNVILESQKAREGRGGNQFEEHISEQREMDYKGHLEFHAGKDIRLQSVNLNAGSLEMEAKGNVIDTATMLDAYEERESDGTKEAKAHKKAHVSHFKVQEDMVLRGNSIFLQGTIADTGDLQLQAKEKIAVVGVNEEEISTKTTEEETGSLFWKGKKTTTESEFHSQFVPAQLNARHQIGIVGKEVTLQAPQVHAEETQIEGKKVRFLLGKNVSKTSYSEESKNPFWYHMESKDEQDETFTQPDIQGKVKIKADSLELEQVKGQVLDYVEHLQYDPAQVEVVSKILEELHNREEKSISAPGPALVAAVAVAASVATGGAGGAAVTAIAGATAATSMAGTALAAGISALTAQIATQAAVGILSQQSIGDILKGITSKDTLKNVATATITAGALNQVAGLQEAAGTCDLLGRVETSATQAGIGMGANLAFGDQNLAEAFKAAGVQFVSQAGSGYVADQIGKHFAGQNDVLSRVTHKIAHGTSAAVFAGGGAAVLGQDVQAAVTGAATGAMASELVGDLLQASFEEDLLKEVKRQEIELDRDLTKDEKAAIGKSKIEDITRIAKLTGAISGLLTGQAQGVNAANVASGNAVDNNCWPTLLGRLAVVVAANYLREGALEGLEPGPEGATDAVNSYPPPGQKELNDLVNKIVPGGPTILKGAKGKTKEEAGQKAYDIFGNPPNHPDYQPPKNWNGQKVKNPNGPGSGYPDKKGNVWQPTDHKGTHAPHWDVQHPGGKHTNVYPE